MAGSLGDLGGLLRQAQQMQRKVQELQEELARREWEGGHGGIRVVVNGHREVVSLTIPPEVVDAEDPTILEDLLVVAMNDVLRKVEEGIAAETKKVTGGLGLPGVL